MSYHIPQLQDLAPCFQQLATILMVDPDDLQPEILVETFKCCLQQHDYWFSYSDDNRVHRKGQMEYNLIDEAAARHAALSNLYKEYCKNKESKGH